MNYHDLTSGLTLLSCLITGGLKAAIQPKVSRPQISSASTSASKSHGEVPAKTHAISRVRLWPLIFFGDARGATYFGLSNPSPIPVDHTASLTPVYSCLVTTLAPPKLVDQLWSKPPTVEDKVDLAHLGLNRYEDRLDCDGVHGRIGS